MERTRIDERQIGVEKNPNCKMTCAQTLQLMMLFPFFALKNAGNYVGSVLAKLFFDSNLCEMSRIFLNFEP
ncbi:MAG: hypothetical protein ACOX5T_09490 [Candidatus Cryptobacteroides sp.]